MHFNAIDITGQRFGRLIAIEPTNRRNGSNIVWKCKCDCGKITYVNTVNIKNTTKSCGCLKQELRKLQKGKNNPNYIHGKCRNYDKTKSYRFDMHLRTRYKINSKIYQRMLKKQNYRCIICKKHKNKQKRRLSVDHDHQTGKIRGLLCDNCNLIIGYAKENIMILKNIIEYLKRSQNGL